jgi:hypothetical protein
MKNRKIRRTTAILCLLVGTLLIGVSPVFALRTQVSGTCSSYPFVYFYENAIGDTGNDDDRLKACGNGGNLTTAHSLSGLCKAFVKPVDNWEDCISSFTAVWGSSSGKVLCIYENRNYDKTGDRWDWFSKGSWDNVRHNLTGASLEPRNDTLSSWRWVTSSSLC